MNKYLLHFIAFLGVFQLNAQISKSLSFGEAQTHIPIAQKDKHVYTFSLEKGDFVQLSIGSGDIWMQTHLLVGKDTIKYMTEWVKDKYIFYAPKKGTYTLSVFPSPDSSNSKQGAYDILCERMSAKERKIIDEQSEQEGEVITSDIVRFWAAYDKLSTCKTLKDSAEMLSRNYYIVGTSSMQGSIKARPMSAFDMARVLKNFPKFYESIRKNSLETVKAKPLVQEIFDKFKKLYPRFTPAKAHFVIGILNFGGTVADQTLYIGAEVACSTKDCNFSEVDEKIPAFAATLKRDKPLERILLEFIAHEGVHVQQQAKQPETSNCNLLANCINEGAADFIGELIVGSHINPTLKEQGDKREKELWDLLNSNLCEGNWGKFLYNYRSNDRGDLPPDMGYYIGYKICESYYKNATDKAQAVVDIIEMSDAKGFLEKSKYPEAKKNETPIDSCNCLLNLNHYIEKVTHNYAGYADKVNDKTRKIYFSMVDSLRNKAVNATDLRACYQLLETYRLYFYDKHLQLGADLPPENTEGVSGQIEGSKLKAEQTTWNRAQIMAFYEKNKGKLKDIEGIWESSGYEVAVIENKQKNAFEGIILSSQNPNFKEGALKWVSYFVKNGVYKTEYVKGNMGKDTVEQSILKNYMAIDRYGTWKKTFPLATDTIALSSFNQQFGEVQWRMLDKKTLYIRLKSCDYTNKPILDSLVKAHKKDLETIPQWIIDFRGNSGGSTDVYQTLLPYAYTKPLISKGSKHWLTPEHTQKFKVFYDKNKQYFDSAIDDYILKLIAFGEKNPNGWHNDALDTLKFDKKKAFPKKIAILSDRKNGSSGETFLIEMKGLSDKVIIFGENSGGYLDYGDLQEFGFPCDKLVSYIPSRRANYLDDGVSYDATGFPPDVRIPADTKDWIQFVFDYWKKK